MCVCVCLGVLWGKDAAVLCHCLPGQIPPSHTPLSAAFSGGSQYVSLSCSGVGVCTDNHHRGGDDGDGGGDHLSAEPLQTLCAILHQPAQPRQAER